jgi:hypothetical protein
MIRLLCIAAMMTLTSFSASPQKAVDGLAFAQVYGSAGFLSTDPAGVMANASTIILAFTAADGHRNLVLTQETGDYIALLETGYYCVTAYTRAGKRLVLGKNQLKCVTVTADKDVRLDVMLVRDKK